MRQRGNAENRSLAELNFEWYSKNHKLVTKQLKQGNQDEAIPIINMLGQIWKNRDGSVWIEVAPSIAHALMYQNELMLIWFQKYPNEWLSWINKFPSALFTAWIGSEEERKELEALRLKMIDKISSHISNARGERIIEMNLQILKELKQSKIRVIN